MTSTPVVAEEDDHKNIHEITNESIQNISFKNMKDKILTPTNNEQANIGVQERTNVEFKENDQNS